MERSTGSTKTRRMLGASAMLLFGSLLYACGGGGSSVAAGSADITQTQFDAKLATSQPWKDLLAKLAEDEKQLATQALIGHKPGTATTKAARTQSVTADRTESVTIGGGSEGATTQSVDNTDYGICADMGQRVQTGFQDLDGTPTDIFKNCTGNKVAYNTETGDVGYAPLIWFTDTTCGTSGGSAIEFEADGAYDRPTLQGGIVFKSPVDGAVKWVKPLGVGEVPQQRTSHSIYSANTRTCVAADETHTGYLAVPNVTDGSDGSAVPNGGAPNTYVYN